MMDVQKALKVTPLDGLKNLLENQCWEGDIASHVDDCIGIHPLCELLKNVDLVSVKDELSNLAVESVLDNYVNVARPPLIIGGIREYLRGFVGGVIATQNYGKLDGARVPNTGEPLSDHGKEGAGIGYVLTKLFDLNTQPFDLKSEIASSGVDVTKVVSACDRLLSKLPKDPDRNSVFDFAREKLAHMK